MTKAEAFIKVRKAVFNAFTKTQKQLPYGKRSYTDELGYAHPGNLAYNSYTIKTIDDYHYQLSISLLVAPYAYYLDQGKPTGNSDKHKGFWNKNINRFTQMIADELKMKIDTEV